MKLLIFAVLFSIAHAFTPIPGQAANKPAQGSQAIQNGPQNDLKKSQISTVQTRPTNNDQKPGDVPTGSDKKEAMVVGEVARMPHKDWWDKSYVIFNGMLVLIGAFGVCAALKTLDAIKKQVGIQQESLRPRLAIGFTKHPLQKTPWTEMVTGKRVTLHVELINTGGIPAYRVVPETWIEYLHHRPFEFTAGAIYYKGEPLMVYPQQATHYRIPFNRALTESEITACRSANATVCVRIKLTYTVWGREAHTQEAFSVEPGSMGTISKYSEAD